MKFICIFNFQSVLLANNILVTKIKLLLQIKFLLKQLSNNTKDGSNHTVHGTLASFVLTNVKLLNSPSDPDCQGISLNSTSIFSSQVYSLFFLESSF